MATRKQPPATKSPAPLANGTAKRVREIPGDDSWVGCRLIDTQSTITQNGHPSVSYQFEVTAPRLYAGTVLYLVMHEGLDKTLDADNPQSTAAQFPGVNLMDAEDAWKNLAHVPLRAHLYHEDSIDPETGEYKGVRLRVASFRPDARARA